MDREEFRGLAKLLCGMIRGDGKPLSDEEFNKTYPDWEEVVDEIAKEGARRRAEKD